MDNKTDESLTEIGDSKILLSTPETIEEIKEDKDGTDSKRNKNPYSLKSFFGG